MEMSEKGIHCLKLWEGFKTKVYKDCAGYLTIGVGHLLTDAEKKNGVIKAGSLTIDFNKTISEAEVEAILKQDLKSFVAAVNTLVKSKLNQNQFDALTSFCFNVGQGNFKASTLLKVLNEGKYADVPSQLKKWNRAGGKVVQGLVNRRENEILLWNGSI